jgi:hypothetical protein
MEQIRNDPLLAASLRGLENLKWKLAAGEGVM